MPYERRPEITINDFLTFLSGEFYNEFSMNFQMNLLKCAFFLCKTVRQQLRKQTKLNPAKAERSFEIILQ